MIALARNFYIFTPRLTARLAAVLLAVRNIAAAWNVRTFLILLDHHNSSDRSGSGFSIFRSSHGLPFSCTAAPRAGRCSRRRCAPVHGYCNQDSIRGRQSVGVLFNGSGKGLSVTRRGYRGHRRGHLISSSRSEPPRMQTGFGHSPQSLRGAVRARVKPTATKVNEISHNSKSGAVQTLPAASRNLRMRNRH